MQRWVLAVLVLLLAAACAPPLPAPLHGRPAFDAWLTDHGVTEIDSNLATTDLECGTYSIPRRLIVLDRSCVNTRYTPGDAEWVHTHLQGHAVDAALGFTQGGTVIGVERGAQCVAEVVLGHDPSYTYDDLGYWDCPADEVTRTEAAMVAAGA